MTAPDLPTDALASALPLVTFLAPNKLPLEARDIAQMQAKRLSESGYVLVPTAPDQVTVKRLSQVIHAETCGCGDAPTSRTYGAAKAVLAALAGTSAQARHTDDNATGGGEDG